MHQLESLPDGFIELLTPERKSLSQRIYAQVKHGKIYSCQVSTSGKIEQVDAAQPRPLSALLWRPQAEGGALTFWYVLGPSKGLFQQDFRRCTAGPCSTSTPPDCVNTADPEPSLLFDHNGGNDCSQQRNHITMAATTSSNDGAGGGVQDESIKIYPFSSKLFAEKYPEPFFDTHLQQHLLKLEPQVQADFTVISLTTPSGGKLYQAACSLHGVSGSQATRTCDASENFPAKQDARRDAARNALVRLESSPDRAFATAWTGTC
jgi:hypothetical protein